MLLLRPQEKLINISSELLWQMNEKTQFLQFFQNNSLTIIFIYILKKKKMKNVAAGIMPNNLLHTGMYVTD